MSIPSYAKSKYGSWYIFGELDEYVDISSSHIGGDGEDILTHVKKSEAEKVIKLHNSMLDELDELVRLHNASKSSGKGV